MITIIGVAHVFDVHERLRDEIISRNPRVVAVELDRGRYEALKEISSSGEAPFIYRVMAHVQKRIGDEYGVQPGSEMKLAVDTAREIGASVAFIDIPATYTFKRLLASMSLKEKLYLVFGMLGGLFVGRERIDREMEEFQDHEEDYMAVVEKNMPSVSRVLLDERNVFMARNILELEERYGSVLAVVGDAHVRGLVEELKERETGVVRLKEIMGEKSTDEVKFSFSYEVHGFLFS